MILFIGNTTYNWSDDRELQSISNTNLNVSYKYDRNGIHTKKILNNEEISYCLENSSMVIEKHKNYMLYFLRDDSNNLLGFTYNNNTYYYKKNAFYDIIGIYDSNYKEVCTYNYDSYGNILSIKDSTVKDITDTSNVAIINPFRYRSYYYDTETNLYYLNSRYYGPKMGRFINSDSILIKTGSILSLNAYCYCLNNPVNRIDSGGRFSNPFSKLREYYEKAKKSVSNVVKGVKKTISNGIDWVKRNFGTKNTHTVSHEVMTVGNVIPFIGGVAGGVNEKNVYGKKNADEPNTFNIDTGDGYVSVGFNRVNIGIDISSGLAATGSVDIGDYFTFNISHGITWDLRYEIKMSLEVSKDFKYITTDGNYDKTEFYGAISNGLLPGTKVLNLLGSIGNIGKNILEPLFSM